MVQWYGRVLYEHIFDGMKSYNIFYVCQYGLKYMSTGKAFYGMLSIALCSYPHVNVEIRDLSQYFTTAPIFPQYHYFRQNIWVNIWVQFHFHFIFMHVINWNIMRHLLRRACTWYYLASNVMFRDELNGSLKKPKAKLQIFHNFFQMKMVVKLFGKYLHQERLPG